MNRRSFLSMMGFVAPAAIVKPTYFFAPPGGWGVKLYSTIGAWADYPGLRTATGVDRLMLQYNPAFLTNLKAKPATFKLLWPQDIPPLEKL